MKFNHIKTGVVTFGGCKPAHYENMNERERLLGDESVMNSTSTNT